ncbi:IucA/IucC family C-terminal-domain containing protein [Cohnella luojiensis]|uniref:Aerobactin siderophore biosynthesis IucA/IucC-like C-terminal domain-containing protein n=1 Tax=Cohnella luojiensis TaxID=652876 RepID=A0A4Y8LQP0_9BACL|nr:IucA/IucC family C-terminal-domain containing protein [Cohnella luojiensis]TFE22867.1 hypothetical protein E2980_20485 [Cohnella luojiensis]
MLIEYTPEEIDVLVKDHRLALEPSADRRYSMPATVLLDQDKSLAYLDKVGSIFEAASNVANASLFAKRYSFLIIASSLYAMSRYDKSLDYSIGNCHVESHHQGQTWLPKVRLTDWQVTAPGEGGRNEWRDQVIRNVFADNLSKAWRALSKSASVSISVLWENTAIYVYWLYENKFMEGADAELKVRLQADYDYLRSEAPAHLFGVTKNPLAKFDSPKVVTCASDHPIRIRKTCCYYYLASDESNDFCSSCPKRHYEAVSIG